MSRTEVKKLNVRPATAAIAQASGRRREAMLLRITAALTRIDDDEYGLCTQCDEPINPKRLEFDPTVLLCIDCASKSEGN